MILKINGRACDALSVLKNFSSTKRSRRDVVWFYALWVHASITGREFLRGLTIERRSCNKEIIEGGICDDDKLPIENWAISVYNEPGAFYINQIWTETLKRKPRIRKIPRDMLSRKLENTSTVKLLYTQTETDYTRRSTVRKADIYRGKMPAQLMRILQINIAVRDDISPTGGVFGSFIYQDNAAPIEASVGKSSVAARRSARRDVRQQIFAKLSKS